MTQERHPDIEIYVKSCSISQIETWFSELSDSWQHEFSQGVTHEYKLSIEGKQIPVLIHEKVAGKAWSSIWFKSDETPWFKDLDCARVAAIALATQVRCIASGWKSGDDPDEWWKIEGDEEALIQWATN